jgi:hypothetical protein
MRGGIMDDDLTLSLGTRDAAFEAYRHLGVKVVRVLLRWDQVAADPPIGDPRNPESYPLEKWARYDAAVRMAKADPANPIEILLNIYGTPSWANGGRPYHPQFAPGGTHLRAFAQAAADRYDGTFEDPDNPGEVLPRVKFWAAWNEPNLHTFLRPQWKRTAGRWVSTSPRLYARICNQTVAGVHAGQAALPGEVVACGVTSPRGNGKPRSSSPSHTPIAFLRGMKKFRARFDVYAHNPYSPKKAPTWKPPRGSGTIAMGNIGVLTKELTRLYGRKKIWITEYGYETKPPDPHLGVSYATQRLWLSKAYGIARRNPRISMFIWFLLRDEPDLNGGGFGVPGWQSGFFRAGVVDVSDLSAPKKPAYATFKNLLH